MTEKDMAEKDMAEKGAAGMRAPCGAFFPLV